VVLKQGMILEELRRIGIDMTREVVVSSSRRRKQAEKVVTPLVHLLQELQAFLSEVDSPPMSPIKLSVSIVEGFYLRRLPCKGELKKKKHLESPLVSVRHRLSHY
jgi:hypothetical protein